MKQKTLPIAMKTMRVTIKIMEFFFVSNPMAKVRRESEINAQMRELPFNNPVIWASPIGKANSQPIS